jgi:hypothetical protein
MSTYILEVQRFEKNGDIEHPEWNGKFDHVGYINKLFYTKNAASLYYNNHNTHMRELNVNNTWTSDWDPNTLLRYVVRRYNGEYLKIPPF